MVVRGYLPSSGNLSAEIDGRIDGLNAGRTAFYSGETAHLLVHAGPEVSDVGMAVSTGTLSANAEQSYQVTQDVSFDGSNSASLNQPAVSIDSVIWLGADLGELSLETDGMTVTAAISGVAIARITCTVQAMSWGLSTPSTVADLDSFPVQVNVNGTAGEAKGDGEIVCQRGNGEFSGEDISDPLLSTTEAMRSRGRAEIDAGEELQEVSLTCVHRPGILPGQIIEVHDALMGRSWQGKITSVAHEAIGPRITTSLEILRGYSTA